MVKFLTEGEISKMDNDGKKKFKFYFWDLQGQLF